MSATPAPNLQTVVDEFVAAWAPVTCWKKRADFINHLRVVLEVYGRAALTHESLPDTEHQHGDPL